MTSRTAERYECPICGFMDASVEDVMQEYVKEPMYQMTCMECCTAGPLSETPEEAINLWGRISLEGECRGCTAE